MKETYEFYIDLEEMLYVGGTIYAPNGRKGEVESITSVKQLDNGKVLIKGIASLD